MARRMYDLDNGTEVIKVKGVVSGSVSTGYQSFHNLGPDGASFSGYVRFPSWTSATRPTLTGFAGSVIYDTDLAKLILWTGNAWVNLDGTALS